jgi:hypothetical protein
MKLRQYQVDVIRIRPDGETFTLRCDYTAADDQDAAMVAIMRSKEMMPDSTLHNLTLTDFGPWNGEQETFQRIEKME